MLSLESLLSVEYQLKFHMSSFFGGKGKQWENMDLFMHLLFKSMPLEIITPERFFYFKITTSISVRNYEAGKNCSKLKRLKKLQNTFIGTGGKNSLHLRKCILCQLFDVCTNSPFGQSGLKKLICFHFLMRNENN